MHIIYPNELELKDAADTQKHFSYLDYHLEMSNGEILKQNSSISSYIPASLLTSVWRLHLTTHTLL